MSCRVPKLLRMVSTAVLVAWCVSSVVSADSKVVAEKSTDLGFGFRKVLRSQKNPPGSFEGIGHFSILYYREQEIGQHGEYSVAPSGRYLVFQDATSGDVVLFTAASKKTTCPAEVPRLSR